MAYPTQDTNHAKEAVALFTDHYRTQLVIPAIMNSLTPKIQELETVFWQIINSFLLANTPVGDQLNAIGSICGCPRGFLNDTDYLNAIRLQIAVNRSNGTANDIINMGLLAIASQGTYANYFESNPQAGTFYHGALFNVITSYNAPFGATYGLELLNVVSPNAIAAQISLGRPAGAYGVLHYTTWAPGNDFMFVSRYGGKPAGIGTFGSRYTGAVGGKMVASAVT